MHYPLKDFNFHIHPVWISDRAVGSQCCVCVCVCGVCGVCVCVCVVCVVCVCVCVLKGSTLHFAWCDIKKKMLHYSVIILGHGNVCVCMCEVKRYCNGVCFQA